MERTGIRPSSLGDGTPSRDLSDELTAGFAAAYIRKTARRLVGKAGITHSDCPDLEQDLTVTLWKQARRYDARRAPWNAYVVTVVRRRASSLLAARFARKRIPECRAGHLSAPAIRGDGKRVELSQLIESRHRTAVTRQFARPDVDQATLRSDMQEVVAGLPLPLRQLCWRLQYEPITEAAKHLRCSRTSLYRRLAHIRLAFLQAGLHHFLEEDRTLGA